MLSIRVDLDIGQMSSFDITFNNWDEQKLRFKYCGDRRTERAFRDRTPGAGAAWGMSVACCPW